MSDTASTNLSQPTLTSEAIRGWAMVVVMIMFIFLYVGVIVSTVRDAGTAGAVKELQPIVLVIIGYSFGWFPFRRSERFFREEIERQTTKTDAAFSAREIAIKESSALEEKIKNVKAALASASPGPDPNNRANFNSVAIAVKLLDS